jgi:large subunit ribosomal protein L9
LRESRKGKPARYISRKGTARLKRVPLSRTAEFLSIPLWQSGILAEPDSEGKRPFAFLGVQGIIAPMKVVLVRDVPRVGKAGDVKEVADGYARNFLLRRNLALPASPAALKDVETRLKKEEQEQQRHVDELTKLAQRLEGLILTFSIKAKAIEGERLYGSIRDNQIAEELGRLTGAAIDRAMVALEAPIRTLGTHELTVRLSKDLTPKVKVVVAREE